MTAGGPTTHAGWLETVAGICRECKRARASFAELEPLDLGTRWCVCAGPPYPPLMDQVVADAVLQDEAVAQTIRLGLLAFTRADRAIRRTRRT